MKTLYFRKIFFTPLFGAIMLFVSGQNASAGSIAAGDDSTKALPRSTPAAEKVKAQGITDYLEAVKNSEQDLHSLMIVRNGKVVSEQWFGDHAADRPHVMFSVSKTYTATAIGFAVSEGRLSVTDKVISFFPDKLPESVGDHLKELEIRHLLT
ncbi:MAG: beta-lactamase family protein, partial [Tannerella sp.]|nr:beta-lactamase family protein [Tannerella sp.]